MDVVVGVEEKKVVLLWNELEGCEGGNSNCVALKRFEIKDVVRAFGDAESISTLSALEGVIPLPTAKCVIAGVSAELIVALAADEEIVALESAEEIVVFLSIELIVSMASGE